MNTLVRILAVFVSSAHLRRQKKETEKFDKSTNDLANNYLRVSNISALLSPATTLIMNIGIICLLTVGGIKVNIGSLQQGQVLALINYMNQMLLALIVVSNLVVIFTRAEASGKSGERGARHRKFDYLKLRSVLLPIFLLKQLSLLTMLTSVILLILVFLSKILHFS